MNLLRALLLIPAAFAGAFTAGAMMRSNNDEVAFYLVGLLLGYFAGIGGGLYFHFT